MSYFIIKTKVAKIFVLFDMALKKMQVFFMEQKHTFANAFGSYSKGGYNATLRDISS